MTQKSGRASRTRSSADPGAPLTILDRLLLGSICAVAGALLGCVLAFFAMLVLDAFQAAIVVSSAAYFFAVGFVKGVGAGDLAGEALGATASAVAAMGHAHVEPTSGARTGGVSTLVLWLGYIVCVSLAVILLW